MRSSYWTLRLILASLAVAGCRDTTCLHPPCPEPAAIDLTVAAASSGAPILATVTVSGALGSTLQCDGVCLIFGTSGMYVLDVTAPGFAPVHRTVQVQGTNPDCGCASTQTEHVTIAMSAS